MNTNELNLINRDLAKIELKSQGCNPEESTKSGRTYRPQSLSKSEAAKMAEFSSKTIDSVMSLYNKAIDPQIKPDQATPYTSLPKYVRTFIHVGLATLKDRTVSLLMNSENFKLLNNSRADAIAEQLKKSIESSEMKSQVFTKEAFNEKGMTLQVPMKKASL